MGGMGSDGQGPFSCFTFVLAPVWLLTWCEINLIKLMTNKFSRQTENLEILCKMIIRTFCAPYKISVEKILTVTAEYGLNYCFTNPKGL